MEDLYMRGGQYEFSGGVNWKAMLALVIGVVVNVPGFLAEAVPGMKDSVPEFWRTLYIYAWFVGFLLSGALHYAFAAMSASPKAEARLRPGR